MATYAELYDKVGDSALKNRLAVAVAVKAQALFDLATPTAAQLAWADSAINDPFGKAEVFFRYLLAKNRALTIAQIDAVTDTAMQTAIDALADKIIAGGTP
jgi:hypothetical protein